MIRLVLVDGTNVGIVTREQALQQATDGGLDLVEVAPDADPPVCRLLDYGKFKYRQKRKVRQKHHKSQLKEIRIGPDTQEHDLQFKAERIIEFLKEHDRVVVSMLLAGRQKAHGDLALERMKAFADRFQDVAKMERPPTRESAGRITFLVAPRA
jgi:translation initiation factor IF-3